MPRLIDYASRWDFVLDSHDLLVFTRGIHGLTLADVAGGAGMSAATLRRLVPSLAAVHASSLRRIERRRAGRHMRLPRTDNKFEGNLAAIMIEAAVAPEHRQDDIVRQAILSVTRRDQRVAVAAAELRASLLEWVASILGDLGVADANGLETIRLMALIDGLNLALLATPDALDPELAKSVLRAHLAQLMER